MEAKQQSLYVDDYKNTNLHFAAARGNLEEMKTLVDNGHRIDVANYLDWTPLMMATRNGSTEAVKFLLHHNADATRKNSFGASIFLMAVCSGNLEILQLILAHLLCGGVSKQSMETFLSPLTVAILFEHEHIFRFLIEKSFNVNAKSVDLGLTPMMFAVNHPNSIFAKKLIIHGASTSGKSMHGDSADEIIAKRKQSQTPCLQHPHSHHRLPKLTIVSPQMINFCPMDSQYRHERKSSNIHSPAIYLSPNMSPVSPMGYNHPQQFFFPSPFPSHQVFSPVNNMSNQDDICNRRLPDNYILSPVPTFINFPPSCVQYPGDNNLLWPVDPRSGY